MQMPAERGGDISSAAAPATPLISIVIPVYNAERDLTACLDAVTGQSFSDFEIIAVNNGSADKSPEILDARAASEPRLVIVHEDKIGPGLARNIGAGLATGRYIWFVDADDAILPDCLAAIAERLESATPDVLLIDYELEYPDGSIVRSPDHATLVQVLPASFTLSDQPRAMDLTMASWNKIIRTQFFSSIGVAFEEQTPHEEIPVTCLLLLEARRLSVLNLACYRYRKDAPGSLMTSGDRRRHFRVFDVWRIALDQVKKQAYSGDDATTSVVYSAFFERAISHCSYLLDAPVRGARASSSPILVSPPDHGEFFENLHRLYIDYKPAQYRRPSGLKGVKFRQIEKNSYLAYWALLRLNGLRLSAKRSIGLGRGSGPRW